mgnify:CR=1 FL=1
MQLVAVRFRALLRLVRLTIDVEVCLRLPVEIAVDGLVLFSALVHTARGQVDLQSAHHDPELVLALHLTELLQVDTSLQVSHVHA